VEVEVNATIPRMGNTEFEGRPGGHEDMNTCSLGLHEAGTGGGSRPRHLSWLATHSKLCFTVTGSLHVGELVGAFLADIVETAGNCITLAFLESSVSQAILIDCKAVALQGLINPCWTIVGCIHLPSTNGDLDRTTGRKEQVDPPGGSVDEAFETVSDRCSGKCVKTYVSCRTSFWTSFSSRRSLNIRCRLVMPPMPLPKLEPTPEGCIYL